MTVKDAVGKPLGVVRRGRGQVVHWDVVNELLHGSLFSDMLPCDGVGPCICDYPPACANMTLAANATSADKLAAWMFQRVRAADPYAALFLNDYGVLETDTDPLSGVGEWHTNSE